MTPLRALILEDSEDDLTLLLLELRRLGYEVTYDCVHTAEAMEEALTAKSWDIVLSDYNMPRFDGLAALELLRSSGHDLPFILISGTVGEDVAVEAMRAGAQDYLIKGRLARLGVAIERELAEARSRAARRAAEAALGKSEATNRGLLRAIPEPIFRFKRDGTILDLIPGSSLEELVEDASLLHAPLHQLFAAPLADEYLHCIERALNARGVQSLEHEIEVNGQRRIVEARFSSCGVDDVIVIVRDITEQRTLEEQIVAAQRMEAVGRLAGGVAHDFNNIMTVIGSFGRFVLEALDPSEPIYEDQLEVLDAAARAETLTHQLLAFSRRQAVHPRIIDINEQLVSIGRLLRRLLGEDICYRSSLAKEQCCVLMDPGCLEQVIINLAVNARDAMPGGGELSIMSAWAREKEHDSAEPNDYVAISVSDTGEGIDAEVKRNIFDPFFTTKAPGKGTGLGLSICFGVVKQAGGFIRVDSEPNQGTTFTVYLPRADRSPDASERTLASKLVGGTETILVVEDEAPVRRAVVRTLKKIGYRVLEAAGAPEALRRCREEPGPIHLLLTDVVMPEMNGRELAERMGKLRPETRVVFMSGYLPGSIFRDGVPSSSAKLVRKPFSLETLTERLREALDAEG